MFLNFCGAWSGRLRVETVGMLRFFVHGGCSRKGLDQELCLNIICSIRASGSFGLFVGQCVASLETSQSDVTRSSLFSSLCAVFSVWEWQVQQSVCQLLFVLDQSSVS